MRQSTVQGAQAWHPSHPAWDGPRGRLSTSKPEPTEDTWGWKTQESQAEVWTLLFVWGKMFATVTDMMKPSRQAETQATAPCTLKILENLELS